MDRGEWRAWDLAVLNIRVLHHLTTIVLQYRLWVQVGCTFEVSGTQVWLISCAVRCGKENRFRTQNQYLVPQMEGGNCTETGVRSSCPPRNYLLPFRKQE